MKHPATHVRHREGGLENFLPPLAGRARRVEANLGTAAAAARTAFARNGAFPANLNALVTASGLPAAGAWRLDPYGAAQDLTYARTATGAQVRSRGPDQRLNTADDFVFAVPGEDLLRARQRARLRLLRALLLASPYRHATTMSPAEVTAMRDATRTIASARRTWREATDPERTALTTAITAAEDTIGDLRFLHGLLTMPTALTGAGGLMAALGRPDNLALDGSGRRLILDPSLGVIAIGWDRRGGTDDDM